jgi:hypothetical protein
MYLSNVPISRSEVFGKELSDGDRILFEFEVQNSVSVTQFLPKDPTTRSPMDSFSHLAPWSSNKHVGQLFVQLGRERRHHPALDTLVSSVFHYTR